MGTAVVEALSENINATILMTEFTTVIPFVASIAVFAFGYNLVKKVISGASVGKVKL